MTGYQKPSSGQVRAKECDMHTHSQIALQSGAEIAASAMAEKNNKDSTGAARSDIWCPMTCGRWGKGKVGMGMALESID